MVVRFRFRAVAVLVLAAVLAAACGGGTDGGGTGGGDGDDGGPVTLSVMNFANYMPEDLPERFKEATGHDVTLTLTASNEDAIAKLQGSPPDAFDVVFLTSPFAEAMINAGVLSELDQGKLTNLDNLFPEVDELAYDPGGRYSVPYAWGTTGMCYRTDLVEEAPDSWNDLLRPSPDLVGKITMIDEDRWLLLPALKVLGYSVNTTDEAELREAADLTIEAKETLLGYDGETFYSKLVSGEASVVMGWDGWCNYGTAEDPNIEFVLPEEGADLWVDVMVIPEGSANKDAAHQFIDFILRPENGLWVAENILYKVPNSDAMEQLDPSYYETYPNMAIDADTLLEQEALRDLGEDHTLWARIASEIKAA